MLFKSVLKAFNSIGLYSLKDTRNSKPQDIIKEPLEEAMKLWLDEEEIKEFYANRDKPKKESNVEKIDLDIQKAWINATQLAFNNDIKVFLYETIMPNIDFLTTKELQLIIKILTVLQDNKDCPSVVSIYNGDSNKVSYGNHLLAGYTQFKALEEFVPLLQHSLSVAKNTLVVLNESKIPSIKKNKMIGQCLICGLAHDLGKIQRFETLNQISHLTDKAKFSTMQKEKPHQEISETMLKEIALLEIRLDLAYVEKIAEAVLKHHNPPNEKDSLLETIINADIKTRNEEKEYCYNKIIEKVSQEKKNIDAKLPLKETRKKISNKEVKEIKETPQKISEINERTKEADNLNDEYGTKENLWISNYAKRDISQNYGLGESNSYLASLSVCPNKLISETILNHYEKEQGKNINELTAFHNEKAILLFFKSSTMARAENTLRKLLLNDELKKSYIGYIPLKNENNLQEAVEKAKEAMEYSKTNNFGITNYANIANPETITKKVITDASLENEVLSGEAFADVAKELELNKEMEFEIDIESFSSQIIKNIAKPDNKGNFFALPYKRRNRILVEVNFFKSLISTLTHCDENEAQQKMNYFIKKFGEPTSNPRLIYEVSTRKGNYNAIYNIILQDGSVVKYPCIPFCAKALKISSAELSMFSNQETLNGLKIELFVAKE